MSNFKKLVLPALCSFLILSACSKDDPPASTLITKTGLQVTTAQEFPAIPNPSSASGTMDITYEKTTRLLTWKVTWTNLSDTITASHIHGTAKAGASAGVKVGFDIPNKAALSGSYSGSTTVDGVFIKEDSLLMNFYYINIHTKKNPGGEIRGQIVLTP